MNLTKAEKGARTQPQPAIRILIADHPVSSRYLLRSILEPNGYNVMEAEDGLQVLVRAQAHQFEVIILDVQIPKLNGYDTATALRKMPALEKTPLLALTRAKGESAPDKIADAGFNDFLVKPISPGRLRKSIANLL